MIETPDRRPPPANPVRQRNRLKPKTRVKKMEVLDILFVLSRWIHIVSAVVAIGGTIFIRFVLAPSGAALPEEAHQQLRSRLLPRWQKFVHACVGLLLLTGGFNLFVAISNKVAPMPYHAIFAVKFLLAMVVFFLGIALTGTSPGFASIRAARKKWLAVMATLGVIVILLSGVLKFLHEQSMAG